LEMLDLIPIHNCVLNRQQLLEAGGFSEVSAYGFWWQACVTLARQGRFIEIDLKPPPARYRLEDYPSQRVPQPVDTVARIAVRYHRPDNLQLLYRDLPELGADTGDGQPAP